MTDKPNPTTTPPVSAPMAVIGVSFLIGLLFWFYAKEGSVINVSTGDKYEREYNAKWNKEKERYDEDMAKYQKNGDMGSVFSNPRYGQLPKKWSELSEGEKASFIKQVDQFNNMTPEELKKYKEFTDAWNHK
jgi:hypothetical protein